MIGCAETSVGNYHHTLSYIPEERRSHLLRSGSHKSRVVFDVLKEHSAFIFKSQEVQEEYLTHDNEGTMVSQNVWNH
jgi:hypothetical protein